MAEGKLENQCADLLVIIGLGKQTHDMEIAARPQMKPTAPNTRSHTRAKRNRSKIPVLEFALRGERVERNLL